MSNDLTKYEIVKMASEAGFIIGKSITTGEPNSPERFATLCRADLETRVSSLVAEVERLKAVIDGKQDLWKLGHLMHEAWLQSDLKQKSHELTTAVTVMEQVIARNEALKSDRDDWKARALKAEAEIERMHVLYHERFDEVCVLQTKVETLRQEYAALRDAIKFLTRKPDVSDKFEILKL